jgi:RNA polymerase sigma-70 factor, ECF subfamily
MISAQAFASFYQETATALRKYVTRCLGQAALADDIVQEAYLRLLHRPPATEDVGELRAYLFGIASNLMTDQWRKRQVEAALPEAAAASETDTNLELDMQHNFLQLRPLDRQLLWLAYVEGASHREIAAALALREASIRVLLSRAREKLLKLVAPSQQPTTRKAPDDPTTRLAGLGQLLKLRPADRTSEAGESP